MERGGVQPLQAVFCLAPTWSKIANRIVSSTPAVWPTLLDETEQRRGFALTLRDPLFLVFARSEATKQSRTAPPPGLLRSARNDGFIASEFALRGAEGLPFGANARTIAQRMKPATAEAPADYSPLAPMHRLLVNETLLRVGKSHCDRAGATCDGPAPRRQRERRQRERRRPTASAAGRPIPQQEPLR